jgi:energy-coupling factor transporter ATP-binding protein EcfA2
MLLRFRVANFRSIREPAEISLVSSSLKTVVPEDGDWRQASLRIAGIYGANGAGKSTVLLAIAFLTDAVRYSATAWADNPSLPYQPFRLDDTSRYEPSEFSLDIVIDRVRYEYGFTATSEKIVSEWLYSYPLNRRRKLFERTAKSEAELIDDPEVLVNLSFSRELSGDNSSAVKTVRPRSLFLSAAANVRHKFLKRIAHGIGHHISFARYDDWDRSARLKMIKDGFAERNDEMTAVTSLLIKAADVGISSVHTTRTDLPVELATLLVDRDTGGESALERLEEIFEDVRDTLVFGHVGRNQEVYELQENDESSGTLAWLSLVVPARDSFRNGDTLLIDELDASLHPRLSAALIALFKNPEINDKGAQLIFTTHDTNLLTDAVGQPLLPDEVWFAEKNRFGETELFGLAEFPIRKTDNFAKRYLSGRYGAIPVVMDIKALHALREHGVMDGSPAELTGHSPPQADSA